MRFLQNFQGFSEIFDGAVRFWLKTTPCALLEALNFGISHAIANLGNLLPNGFR